MRSRCRPPLPSFELEVLDGNDLPESWVGRQVSVETVTSPQRLTVGQLQSKSAWRLIVVDDRTGEVRCIPWIAVEAVSLLEEEPEAQTARREEKRVPRLDRHARPHGRGVPAAYERFLGWPVAVVLAMVWLLGGLALLGLCALALYLVGALLVRALAGA
jgi:hypothetical protein